MSDTLAHRSMVAWNLTDILLGHVLCARHVRRDAAAQLKLALCRYRHRAGHRRPHGLFSESHPALEPPRPQAELPHHRRAGASPARRRRRPSASRSRTRPFRALIKEMHDCWHPCARLNAVYIPLCCSVLAAVAIVLLRRLYGRSRCCRSPRSRPSRHAVIFRADPDAAANIANSSPAGLIERVTGPGCWTKSRRSPPTPEVIACAMMPSTAKTGSRCATSSSATSRSADGGEDVLSHFAENPAGTTVAIVGETGAGKSTLGNLARRFLEPTSGQIPSTAGLP